MISAACFVLPCPCRVSPPRQGRYLCLVGGGGMQTSVATHAVSIHQAFLCKDWLSAVSAVHADVYRFKISTPSKKSRFHFSAFFSPH